MHSATFFPPHYEVELLAFHLWQERGAPIGTPEIDWFRAENELKAPEPAPDNNTVPALLGVAEAIGSALGSVAALVNTKP